MSNDGSVVSRCLGKRSSVTDLLLDVADDCSFRALRDGENVSDVQSSLLSTVDERSGSDTLGSDESLLSELVPVWVSEDDNGEGSSTRSSALVPVRRCSLQHVLRFISIFRGGSSLTLSPSFDIRSYLHTTPFPCPCCKLPKANNNPPSRIVDDLPNDTPDVTVLLCEIQVPELGGVLVEIGVGSENTTRLPLGSDDSL